MNVLVADRDQGCAAAVARALRRSGMVADVATVWSVAIAMNGSVAYDVVVMDQGLPDTAREIHPPASRELDREGAALLVFAHAAAGDLNATVRRGEDALVHKPFVMDELVRLVRGFATQRERSSS